MRVLILSEKINGEQEFGKNTYTPSYDINLDIDDVNKIKNFKSSVFDYDVSIIHIKKPTKYTAGYCENLPKILEDSKIALNNGRSIIVLPKSENFTVSGSSYVNIKAYQWLGELGIKLKDNEGFNTKPFGLGKSKAIANYLRHTYKYFQIISEYDPINDEKLVIVEDTEITVGIEHPFGTGILVILPPPVYTEDSYFSCMSDLMQLARHYHEKAFRKIYIGDSPKWIDDYLTKRSVEINNDIKKLEEEKQKLDLISYSLYGTGNELEDSIALIFEELGLKVYPQVVGANIDFKAKCIKEKISFAIEVTGIKGIIKKGSKKISQAWKHISDRKGTEEELEKLIIIANTQCHLDPRNRNLDSYSVNVVNLLKKHDVLLMTTIHLYKLWKSVYEEKKNSKQIILDIYKQSGLYKP